MKTLGVFWIPVTSKAYLPFVPTLLLFDLVLSTAADITGRAHRAQTQQLSTECRADTHTQSPQFQFDRVPYKSDPFSFFVHIHNKQQQGPILWQYKSQDHHDDDKVIPQAPSSSSEIDSFAEVSNRDIVPFVGMNKYFVSPMR